jgi:hypothetical protein
VLDAAELAYNSSWGMAPSASHVIVAAAAALRAAADQRKLGPDEWEGSQPDDYERGWNAALRSITAIANELDPTP